MKNILVITGGFPTASQTFVTREVASMLDKGFNVTVLCSNEGDDMGKNLFSELECQRCKVICVDFFSRHLPFTKGIASDVKLFVLTFFHVTYHLLRVLPEPFRTSLSNIMDTIGRLES